jgi:sodium/bile acid cotransporter 7
MRKLALIVVAPLILAQLVRRMGAASWADRNKFRLSTLAQLGILVMVTFGAVASATRVSESGVEPTAWINMVLLILLAAAIHLAALWIGVMIARQSGSPREAQIAVGMAGSQKTLMVGLQIAIDCGVSVVPMLVYHLSQLVLDTIVAGKWKAQTDALSGSQPQQ